MAKMKLKGSNHLDDLICCMELNEYKNIEILIRLYPEVIKQKCLDNNEPIYFAIRLKASKIFNLLLNNSENITYDLPVMMKTIIEEGTQKMLRAFINYYKIDLQFPVYKPLIDKILLQHSAFHSYLINETKMPYSISISPHVYSSLGYNCPFEEVNEKYKLSFNKSDKCNCYDLDSIAQSNQLEKTDFLIIKYEKLLLYATKATKLQKALKEDTIKDIIGYI